MGTRADFYIGSGKTAKWLGSIAWDGYDIPETITSATTPKEYRKAVAEFLASRDDGTTPEDGWPWPWDDSRTSDYAYSFRYGSKKVRASCFGHNWFDPVNPGQPKNEDDDPTHRGGESAIFPSMKEKQAVTLGPRSGVMVISV